MLRELYYTPPSDKIFAEVKEKAIEIWSTYDNEHGYVDEKVGRIKDLENVRDNLMYMVAMFDASNQHKLGSLLSKEARRAVRDRMISGGQPENLIPFTFSWEGGDEE